MGKDENNSDLLDVLTILYLDNPKEENDETNSNLVRINVYDINNSLTQVKEKIKEDCFDFYDHVHLVQVERKGEDSFDLLRDIHINNKTLVQSRGKSDDYFGVQVYFYKGNLHLYQNNEVRVRTC